MTRLVFGAKGQVGSVLMRLLGKDAVGLDRSDVDLADTESVVAALKNYAPTAVINAAAYTQVDRAESESKLAFAINGAAPQVMAGYCASQQIPYVMYSTDYVFGDSGSAAHTEYDTTAPLNVYGKSKLAGEEAVAAEGGKYLILRTSWVYDAEGKNFLTTMLRLGREHEEVRVVNDQHGAPTYAPHLALATLQALKEAQRKDYEFPSGIYHCCNAGETTWHGFAQAIFAAAKMNLRVVPIATAEYPTPAGRPLNSRLDCTKLRKVLGVILPNWNEGLKAAMEVIDAPH